MTVPSRGPGRPRDVSMNERALAATRELLVEVGFAGTTIQAVAGRSGLHASAIYRRWPSRIELIEEAIFPGLSPVSVKPTGDLRRDLRRFINAYIAALGAPAALAASSGLFAHYQSVGHPRSRDEYLQVSARPQFQDVLCAAPAGSVDPSVDPDDVFDMLLGALLTRTLIPPPPGRGRPVGRLVDMVVRLLQPVSIDATRNV